MIYPSSLGFRVLSYGILVFFWLFFCCVRNVVNLNNHMRTLAHDVLPAIQQLFSGAVLRE
jgi:hypothetical protein